MTTHPHNDPTPTADAARPLPLLAGLFVGFGSAAACMGFYWFLAAVFPAIVAGLAALTPIDGHWLFVRGAMMAVLGALTFEIVFYGIMMLTL